MPEPVREGTYKGKPTIGVLTGVGRDGSDGDVYAHDDAKTPTPAQIKGGRIWKTI